MRDHEIALLLSDRLSNVYRNYTEGHRVLGFAGLHTLRDGRTVQVTVRLIDESDHRDSYYRCRVSSVGGRYMTEGPLMHSVEAAIVAVQWSDLDGWRPYQNGG